MNSVRRAAAIFATVFSVAALILALLGGGLMSALGGLLKAVGLGGEMGIGSHPLGAGVFAVYAVGIALGLASSRWPVAAGIAMLPLGACAFLFGGPIAKVFGIVIMCAGGILLATSLRRGKA